MPKWLVKLTDALPFGNKPGGKWGIVAFLTALLIVLGSLGYCSRAKADELDFSVGSAIVHGSGMAIGLYYRHDLPLGFGTDRPLRLFVGTTMVGANGLGDGNNWAWAGGLESNRGYLHMGIGASYFANIDRLNGQHANYELYISYRRWSWCPLTIVHFSDAGTSLINTGRNIVECEWKWR